MSGNHVFFVVISTEVLISLFLPKPRFAARNTRDVDYRRMIDVEKT